MLRWEQGQSWPESTGAALGAVFLLACLTVAAIVAVLMWLWAYGTGRVLLAVGDGVGVALFVALAYLIRYQTLVELLPWPLAAPALGLACALATLLVTPPPRALGRKAGEPS